MKRIFESIFNTPWYPLAGSIYPVVYLLAANTGQVFLQAGARPVIVSMILCGVLFLMAWLFLKNTHASALFTTLLLALFFSYGHAYMAIQEKWPEKEYVRWLPAAWFTLFLIFIFWVTRPGLDFSSATPSLNLMLLVLALMPVFQLDSGVQRSGAYTLGAENAPVQDDLVPPENPPDVYYFLLDSYARADALEAAYGFDNNEFINGLKERGFYVAECSQSNYVRTEISLASTLNMQYLQDLDDDFRPGNRSRYVLWNSLNHSAVRYNFDRLGYEFVNFASGFAWLEIRDADRFYSPPPLSSGMSEFEGLFLRTTLARYAQDWGWVDPDAVMGDGFRDRFNNIFDHAYELTQLPGPQFNYLHVISPHPPFVFDPDGNPTYPPDFWNEQRAYPPDLYQRGYLSQLPHLNRRVLEAVDVILENSDQPPIIIIQGDHGMWLQPKERRLQILNAYYWPGHEDVLYPSITPVNTFRLLFNTYFGGKYDMLDDASYFNPPDLLYDYEEIANPCGE